MRIEDYGIPIVARFSGYPKDINLPLAEFYLFNGMVYIVVDRVELYKCTLSQWSHSKYPDWIKCQKNEARK